MSVLLQDCRFVRDFQKNKLISGLDDRTGTDSPSPPLFSDEKKTDYERPMFSWGLIGDDSSQCGFSFSSDWDLAETLEGGLSLEELAEEHLQNHAFPKNGHETDGDDAVSALKEDLEKLRTQEKQDIVETDELLLMKEPSPLGRVLCKKQRAGKSATIIDVHSLPRCPPEIKPFDFESLSPDDIVRESQKGQKRAIRK